MYKLRLTENGWIQNFIVSQPEMGMGYQFVELHLKDGSVISTALVVNALVICLPDRYQNISEIDIVKIVMPDGVIQDSPR